jgi:hypothetical protein
MDLGFLKSLYENPPGDGYVSVYLDTTPSTASAAAELALRWRSVRERVAAAGAGDATLDAVADALSSRAHEAEGQAVFGAGGAVRLRAELPHPPRREISAFAPLPRVMPLLAQLPPRVPHVRISAERSGGTVITVPATGAPSREDIRGKSWPVHKVSAWGWSEQRLQRSAEETWADNAKRIAGAAAAGAARTGAEFAVLGGDVRERTIVLGLLPPQLRDATVVIRKEVAADSAAFSKAAEAESARRQEAESSARLDEFRTRVSGKDAAARRAAEGMDNTLKALREGLASDLLVAGDPDAGDGATADADGLDALVEAAVGTGADLFILPPDADPPRDGVAALLRAPLAAV